MVEEWHTDLPRPRHRVAVPIAQKLLQFALHRIAVEPARERVAPDDRRLGRPLIAKRLAPVRFPPREHLAPRRPGRPRWAPRTAGEAVKPRGDACDERPRAERERPRMSRAKAPPLAPERY